MRNFFYGRLAASNLRNHQQFTLPYLLAGICNVCLFYMMGAIADNPQLEAATKESAMVSIMHFGTAVIGIMAVILLFYADSFLMKRRKKELGLYNILGMAKHHVGHMLFWETVYAWLISVTAGILAGILFSKLLFMAITKAMQLNLAMKYYISLPYIGLSLVIFAGIYLASFLFHLVQLKLNNPVELLRGGKVGEREPKTHWLLVILGLIALGTGYYISITTTSPLQAINIFFLAVVLVIVGTYFLMIAGTVALLKFLRKRPNYYYQTNHFTAVSGLLYRMKQNAVGMASIAILATAVLVTVSSTASLYIGQADMLKQHFPRNIHYEQNCDVAANWNSTAEEALEYARQKGYSPKNAAFYTCASCNAIEKGNVFRIDQDLFDSYNDAGFCDLQLLPAREYERLTGRSAHLAENQILLYSSRGIQKEQVQLLNRTWRVVENLEELSVPGMTEHVYPLYCMVVPDSEDLYALTALQEETTGFSFSGVKMSLWFDLDGGSQAQKDCVNLLNEWIQARQPDQGDKSSSGYQISCRAEMEEANKSSFGAFFFLGLFLGTVFLLATVLIIYYKQISEGFDDRDRYIIMQHVGMSHKEVRRSIHSQVLIIFFLPLLTAGCHIAAAFPLIQRLLRLFYLYNTGLIVACTVGVYVIFAILYFIVYQLTSRVYYKLVS